MARSLAFFGAFNPPTRAHIDLAEFAREAVGAEDVIFVPSKSVYIRDEQKKSFVFSDEDRIKMLQRITADRPKARWTDIEMKQAEQPKTYHTLCMLREQGEDPALLVGADKLPELEHLWCYVREMADEFGIVCMDRGDMDCETMIRENPFLASLHLQVVHVPDIYKNVSSTRVRECLFQFNILKNELLSLLPPELAYLPADLLR